MILSRSPLTFLQCDDNTARCPALLEEPCELCEELRNKRKGSSSCFNHDSLHFSPDLCSSWSDNNSRENMNSFNFLLTGHTLVKSCHRRHFREAFWFVFVETVSTGELWDIIQTRRHKYFRKHVFSQEHITEKVGFSTSGTAVFKVAVCYVASC